MLLLGLYDPEVILSRLCRLCNVLCARRGTWCTRGGADGADEVPNRGRSRWGNLKEQANQGNMRIFAALQYMLAEDRGEFNSKRCRILG
jgi:hypothetical protein